MPPKKGASGKHASKKRDGVAGSSEDIDFLVGLGPECTRNEAVQLLDAFLAARAKKQKDVLRASADAVRAVCAEPHGLMTLVAAEGVEKIAPVAADPHDAGGKHTLPVVEELCRGVVAWLDSIDAVDFTLLSKILHFAHWLGGADEDVAVASLICMGRFARYRAENAAGMLEAGVLRTVHGMMYVHRGPEFVEEVFSLLYVLCDMPADATVNALSDELEILGTVTEMLQEAPLNMKLQVSGLRFLAMLSTRFRSRKLLEIPQAIHEAGAKVLLESAMDKLRSSGFSHLCAWLACVAGRSFDVSA